jgi:hypothetical protein
MPFDHIFSRLNVPGALNHINSNRTGYEASNDDLNDDMESMWKEEPVWTHCHRICLKDWETHDNLSALPASGRTRYFQNL